MRSMKKSVAAGIGILVLIVLSALSIYVFRPRLIVKSYPNKEGYYIGLMLRPGSKSTWRISGKYEDLARKTTTSFTGQSTDLFKDVSAGRVDKKGEAYFEHDSELVTDFNPFQNVRHDVMERVEIIYRYVQPSFMVPYEVTFENTRGRNTYHVEKATRLPTRLTTRSTLHSVIQYYGSPAVNSKITIGDSVVIDVPLGQFTCLEYESLTKTSQMNSRVKGYFCPTLGIMPKFVRTDESKYGRLTISYELTGTNVHELNEDRLKISRSKLN